MSEIEPIVNDLIKMTEMCVEKDKEIERLNNDIKELRELLEYKNDKIESLHSIIKEVREKIRNVNITYLGLRSGKTFIATLLNDILGILDKENNNE